jgi:hypothetical protein
VARRRDLAGIRDPRPRFFLKQRLQSRRHGLPPAAARLLPLRLDRIAAGGTVIALAPVSLSVRELDV